MPRRSRWSILSTIVLLCALMALLPQAAKAYKSRGVSLGNGGAASTSARAPRLHPELALPSIRATLTAAESSNSSATSPVLRYEIVRRIPGAVIARRGHNRVLVEHERAHLVGNDRVRFLVIRRSAQAVFLRSSDDTKPGFAFGISYGDTLMWATDAEDVVKLDEAAALGVGWIRLDLNWNNIQPDSASSYDWGHFDWIVHAARVRGLSLLPTISYTPPWARPAGADGDQWAPVNPSQFAAFAAAAVRRYAPEGIHTWEIWNEPNNLEFWAPRPDPTAYVQLLRLTAAAMRQADPHVFIVSGGLAPVTTSKGNISPLEFFASMCALGANRLIDAVGFHPYAYPTVAPQNSASWNSWRQIATTSPSIRTILAKFGTPNLPIWATEYGAPTDGPGIAANSAGIPPGTNPNHVDEAFQAELATDSVKAALETPGMSALFWYTDRDRGTDPSVCQNFFGLERADGTRKPAFYALQSALEQWRVGTATP